MPRDNNKDNGPRGRRDRPAGGKGPSGGKGASGGKSASGGKGRSGAARGPEKKFAKRGLAKPEGAGGEARSYAKPSFEKKPYEKKAYDKKPYAGGGKPFGKRDDDRPARSSDRPDRGPRKEFGEKRPYASREGAEKRPYSPRPGSR